MKEKTIICISCYYKGYEFMDEMKKLGNKVILITSENLKDKKWPWHAIDEVYYMSEIEPSIWNYENLIQGFSYLLKENQIDAVIALDDYDVEKAAMIRETFRIPGMGQTTHRYFRDKLAMRQMAKDQGINVPEFSSIFNNEKINKFIETVPAPWVLKPRSEASASGIIKITKKEDLWPAIERLGQERHKFLLESFKPGDVYHVDSLIYEKQIIYTSVSKYLSTPMEVSHEGGVFRTKTLGRYSEDFIALEKANTAVIQGFGLHYGATHTEFIKGKEDGKWYFLETSSRVGGAHIPDLIEASSGINIWREWAKIETSLLRNEPYLLKSPTGFFAGLIIALAKEKKPDTTVLQAEEVVRFLDIDHHIGVIYKSEDEDKLVSRLDEAANLITKNILNIIPPTNKPSNQ